MKKDEVSIELLKDEEFRRTIIVDTTALNTVAYISQHRALK